MRAQVTIERGWSIQEPVRGRAQPPGDFAVVGIFSVAGLTLTALSLALVPVEQLAQILAAAG